MKVTQCPPAHDPSLEYDSHQFARKTTRNKLLKVMDRSDAARTQVIRRTRHPKITPDWVKDKELFQKVVASRPYAKSKISKWLRIIYLYYTCDWRAKDVAEELGMSRNAVKKTIQRLNENGTNSKDI